MGNRVEVTSAPVHFGERALSCVGVNGNWHDVRVLKAYVDESYSSSMYYVAAAVGSQECWDQLSTDFDKIRLTTALIHGTDTDIEFHGHELMGGVGQWSALRGRHREASLIYRTALRACREAGVKFILRGLDVELLNQRYKYPQQPHGIVFGHLLERIDDYAAHASEMTPVSVIADEIATQAQHLSQFAAYQTRGTPGYRPSRLPRIASPITFAPSHLHDGLQAVDLAVYLHRRREAGPERHPAAARLRKRLVAELDACTAHDWTWYP